VNKIGTKFKNSKGITLIALVITIIVMLILAGVSLNAIVGDNGIITNAMNANILSNLSELEEWLQEKYVEYYEDAENYSNKQELLAAKMPSLFLKDGSRNFIMYDGQIYYVLNKKALKTYCEDMYNKLSGGDTNEYAKYTRLIDVYGVTDELKIFYCNTEDGTVYGSLDSSNIDITKIAAAAINSDSAMKNFITSELENYGITVGSDGVTLSNTSVLRNLEIDGTQESAKDITSLIGLSDVKNLRTLTLSNLNLANLSGLESCANLYYLYLKNCTVSDYTTLCLCINLQYLYLYLPNTMVENTAVAQVINLGNGLSGASELKKLTNFGISGNTVMFDDTVTKNMDNPANYSYTNKLLYTSSAKSNLTSLGENSSTTKTGLAKFNDTIKKSIKYLYLNNNSISDVYALVDFSQIIELQLLCNNNLSDIDGLTGKTTINWLTLHNCNLNSLGTKIVSGSTTTYSGGLTGCTGLKKLTVQSNSNLTSLTGLEQSSQLLYLIANNCNITDISALTNKSKVQYLKLSNNTNLENVNYIQYCKALKYIYLDNNEKMEETSVDYALNGTLSTLGSDVLIKNCINSYNNIPKKYWDLFTSTATVLDWSVDKLGKLLTNSSPEWIKLRNRTDVTRLRLTGQTQLKMNDETIGTGDSAITYYGISSVLKSLNGMVALSLKDCSQITNIDFVEPVYNGEGNAQKLVSGMPKLVEIDLRNCLLTANASGKVDLSKLNSCAKLNNLFINDRRIDFSLIQTVIDRFRHTGCSSSWVSQNAYSCCGLTIDDHASYYDFSKCTSLQHFCGGSQSFYGERNDATSILDLSGCSNLSYICYRHPNFGIILPPATTYVYVDGTPSVAIIDFSKITSGDVTVNFNYFDKTKWENSAATIKSGTIFRFCGWQNYFTSFDGLALLGDINWIDYSDDNRNKITSFSGSENMESIIGVKYGNNGTITTMDGIDGASSLKCLKIYNCPKLSDFTALESLNGITFLDIHNTGLSNISFISNMTNLDMKDYTSYGKYKNTYDSTLNLSNNNIVDLRPFSVLVDNCNGHINFTSLDLSNNSLDGYSITNNVEILLKLHSAGLIHVNITGNNFTDMEVNQLLNGATINGVEYTGFGAGHVVN